MSDVTVTELVVYLTNLADQGHGDRVVIMSKDAEGNGFSPFCGDHSEGVYVPNSTYSGEFYSDKELRESPEDYEDMDTDGSPAIVLWPIN